MDIFTEIKKILAAILNLEDQAITPESYILRELNAESVDLLELAAALQDTFKIEINEALLFLPGIRGGEAPQASSIPFLTPERLKEIKADLADRPVLKVKDLVSYVAWKLHEER